MKLGNEWVELDGSLLPSPFTPKGERPEGPAWYASPTQRSSATRCARSRRGSGTTTSRYLDGWYQRLRDAYLATMADLGVPANMTLADFLSAMDGYKSRDPELAIVVSAIKATVKGGLDKLRERPRGEGWRPGEPWRALSRPTWRPDVRAAVISRRLSTQRVCAESHFQTTRAAMSVLPRLPARSVRCATSWRTSS